MVESVPDQGSPSTAGPRPPGQTHVGPWGYGTGVAVILILILVEPRCRVWAWAHHNSIIPPAHQRHDDQIQFQVHRLQASARAGTRTRDCQAEDQARRVGEATGARRDRRVRRALLRQPSSYLRELRIGKLPGHALRRLLLVRLRQMQEEDRRPHQDLP